VTATTGGSGRLREEVRQEYSAIARSPGSQHRFPVGRALAEGVGYLPDWLDSLPVVAVDAFAGVSCLPCFAEVDQSTAVLDLGCGAGLDSLVLARSARSVLGVDFSREMLTRARRAAATAGVSNVDFNVGDAEAVPAPDASIDVAVVNGIFNLNPQRERIFENLARVLRPGGRAYAAELILERPMPPARVTDPGDWFT
jgi:arsenite methyltransferase